MSNNWKPIDRGFTISPEAMNALCNSHTNNLRESLKPSVNYEAIKHNKTDDIISELRTQNYLAAERLSEQAEVNRQLKNENEMLEKNFDDFKNQNDEFKEVIEKASKPQWKFTIISGVIVGVTVLFVGWLCNQFDISLSDIINLLQRK